MIEGKYIVIEGVDGAGTTTHTRILTEHLADRGLPVHSTREPSNGPIGTLLRQVLAGRVIVPGLHGGRPPSWSTMALLFAADRLDHIEAEVLPNLIDGVTVVGDRYDYSSVAYQSTTGDGEPDTIAWVLNLNRHARRPDLTVVLDLPASVASRRRFTRRAGREIYDDEDLQRLLATFYADVEKHFPSDNVVHVDANRPVEVVAADVRAHAERLLADL